jgi:uncharacterized YccA/Bax inhibitor family protein
MRTGMRTSNPAMRAMEKQMPVASAIPMTIQGTVNKTGILFLLTLVTATITWKMTMAGNAIASTLMWVGVIGGFITAMVAIFSVKTIHITAPLYSLFEGLFLGAISAVFTNAFYKGIVFQAIGITMAVFAAMLIMYKLRIIKASPAFTKMLLIATGGIALYYIVVIIASFFGADYSVFAMGGFGIGVQLVIVAIAALNLILDFNFIEQGAAQGLPKQMEWYGAFGLMVTLIWLYIEILRLLALFSRR